MNRVEFGDFYRFCVSLGLVLILASVALPWLLISDDGLAKAATELVSPPEPSTKASLSTRASRIIARRSFLVLTAYRAVVGVSVVLFVLGLMFFTYGLLKWASRQLARDRGENADIEGRVSRLMPEAPVQRVEADRRAEQSAEANVVAPPGIESPVMGSPHVESRGISYTPQSVYRFIEIAVASSYSMFQERELGSSVIDCLLLAKDRRRRDLLVELKFISRGFGTNWFLEAVLRLVALVDLYELKVERNARGLLMLVIDAKVLASLERSAVVTDAFALLDRYKDRVGVRILSSDFLGRQGRIDAQFFSATPPKMVFK